LARNDVNVDLVAKIEKAGRNERIRLSHAT
jgi:hypothetical protein